MLLSLALACAAFAVACDIEPTTSDNSIGPAMFVVGNSIVANGGVVPADGVIQLAFDRYLLPATVTRQSFAIVDGDNALLAKTSVKTVYDPVARTVTIFGPDGPGVAWLTPDASYKLVLLLPEDPKADIGGFRAIDRAPLSPKQKLQFVFRAGSPARQSTFEPSVDFCTDVLPIFVGKCSGSLCHGASANAASSLVLASADAVRTTAIGRVAHGSNVNARASTVAPTPSNFGANMAIIAPGDPGSSWLTYKLELARPLAIDTGPKPTIGCFSPTSTSKPPEPAVDFVPLTTANRNPSESERSILENYILGREMPYPQPAPTAWFYTPLDFQERQRIRIWIARGAELHECGACEISAE